MNEVDAPLQSPRPLCPFLPQTYREELCADHIHALGKDRSERFYQTSLEYAQKLWLIGFPAKSLLHINRALACRLEGHSLQSPSESTQRAPYLAVAWILKHRDHGGFIGNPRRHYQHLATRMVEPHKELRVWRAWACWCLSKSILPPQEFPPDVQQIWKEQILEPSRSEIQSQLQQHSPSDDVEAWLHALRFIKNKPKVAHNKDLQNFSEPQVAPIERPDQLHWIQKLAHEIWPECYSAILSDTQIQYMLAQQYELPALTELFAKPHYKFWLTRNSSSSNPNGFLAFEIETSQTLAYLHKIYLKQELRHQGIGANLLRYLENYLLKSGIEEIRLRVNKFNYHAISAYTRSGYKIESEIVTDIGNGFVMDDYELSKKLGKSPIT